MIDAALYTLGNSDIQIFNVDNKMITRPNNFREVTKNFWEYMRKNEIIINVNKVVFKHPVKVSIASYKGVIDEEVEYLTFPLLTAFLDKIRECKGSQPDKLFLFATDQQNEYEKEKDTIYLAKIMEKALECQWKYHLKNVQIEVIQNKPNNYINMEKYFEEFFQKNKKLVLTMNYVQVTAGTPAMNFNLVLNVLEGRHKIFYLEEIKKQKITLAEELDYFTRRHYQNYMKMLIEALNGLSFQVAKEIFMKAPFKNRLNEECLIDVLLELRNFNFDEARIKAERAGNSDIIDMVIELSENENLDRILFVLDLIEKYQKNKQFLDSMVLLAGVYEQLRIYIFEKVTGIAISDKSGFVKFVEQDKDLLEKIDLPISDIKPDKPILSIIFNYLIEQGKVDEETKKMLICFAQNNSETEKIQLKRNSTIFAHGVSGISEDQYNALVKDLVGRTKKLIIYDILGRKKEEIKVNIIETISNKIISLIQLD